MQSSKDKSKFGKGDIRGVIGPESSNNAKEGGELVPTLIFGIPSSGIMAMFLGGIALLGYDPGPHMVLHNLDITYTIVCSLALANVLGAGLCILLSGQIAKLTTIRFALVCCIALLAQMRRAPEAHALFADNERGGEDSETPHGLCSTLAWFGFLLVLSSLLDFILALEIFFLSFLRIRAGLG